MRCPVSSLLWEGQDLCDRINLTLGASAVLDVAVPVFALLVYHLTLSFSVSFVHLISPVRG